MDIVQALTIDIPVKAYRLTRDKEKFRTTLRKQAIQFLKHNGNYFANGVVYPNTLEVLDWHTGIKRGSILGDEMVFTTNIRACFRMYPVGTVHTGTIKSISATTVKINDEYMYDIEVPIVKTQAPVAVSTIMHFEKSEEEKKREAEEAKWTNKKIEETLRNNNPLYPYLANGIEPSNLAVGQTVVFAVLELSSKNNHANIIVLSFLIGIIQEYTKIYSVNCGNNILQTPQMITSPQHAIDNVPMLLPMYYMIQDHYYYIGEDFNFGGTRVDEPVDAPVKNYYICYCMNSINADAINNVAEKSVVLIKLTLDKNVTSPLTEKQFNQICKQFANITMYYDWPTEQEQQYTMWIVCSYRI